MKVYVTVDFSAAISSRIGKVDVLEFSMEVQRTLTMDEVMDKAYETALKEIEKTLPETWPVDFHVLRIRVVAEDQYQTNPEFR
jgi:hypothetical protein